jgi:hypothetical protein
MYASFYVTCFIILTCHVLPCDMYVCMLCVTVLYSFLLSVAEPLNAVAVLCDVIYSLRFYFVFVTCSCSWWQGDWAHGWSAADGSAVCVAYVCCMCVCCLFF